MLRLKSLSASSCGVGQRTSSQRPGMTCSVKARNGAEPVPVQMIYGKGDNVAFLTYNLPEQITGFYALMKIGAVPVPINYRLAANEVKYIVSELGRYGMST